MSLDSIICTQCAAIVAITANIQCTHTHIQTHSHAHTANKTKTFVSIRLFFNYPLFCVSFHPFSIPLHSLAGCRTVGYLFLFGLFPLHCAVCKLNRMVVVLIFLRDYFSYHPINVSGCMSTHTCGCVCVCVYLYVSVPLGNTQVQARALFASLFFKV